MRMSCLSLFKTATVLWMMVTPLVAFAQKTQLNVGQHYFVSVENLNVRSSNSTTDANIVGKLALNDVVEVYDLLNEATPLVQVKILKSARVAPDVAPELFVSKDYLSPVEVEWLGSTSKYFVIQNIATEKTRVYERSRVPGGPHTLVFETDTVVGRPEEGTKYDPKAFITWLGHTQIADWVKFYSDGAGDYIPWYTEGQKIEDIPKPLSHYPTKTLGAARWRRRGPNGFTIYGAFGWFAARLTPADETGANYQWLHGTIGWGEDEDKAIELTRGFFTNLFTNPGSHGCTRLENRSIAFLRHLLPPGTDIFRVYARESTREKEEVKDHKVIKPLPRYATKYNNPGYWEYILLTDGAQQSNGLTADAGTIRGSGLSIRKGVNFIEQGIFKYDRYPTAARLDYTNSAASGTSGDRYRIDSGHQKDPSHFRGYFLVDEGRFVDYQHPDERAVKGKVRVSGLPDFRSSVPDFLKTIGTHFPPRVKYR